MRLLTPYGVGGVAVVAAASPADRARLFALLRDRRGQPIATAPGAPPRRCLLQLAGGVADDVLVVDRASALEVHLHGSPPLLDALAAAVGPWEPPSAAAAQALLQRAISTAQLDLALEQLAWDFDHFLHQVSSLPGPERGAAVAAAVARSRIALALALPCPLALVGRQNAGKSTLFNRLLFAERALAGPQPGLTRDPLREVTALAGYPFELVDTAGEGTAVDAIDQRAQLLAREASAGALRLLLVDAAVGPSDLDRSLLQPDAVVVATKADLPAAPWPAEFPCDLRLSSLDPASAPALRTAVGELLRARRGLPAAGPVGGPAALDRSQWERLATLAGALADGSA